MSLHRADRDHSTNQSVDRLIRWALHNSVADAEPAPEVWERIQERLLDDADTSVSKLPFWRKALSWRRWLSRLVDAGAAFLFPGDIEQAWLEQSYYFDTGVPLSVVHSESKLLVPRLVS